MNNQIATVVVNSSKKCLQIMQALKKAGRVAHYDKFYGYNFNTWYIYYKPLA